MNLEGYKDVHRGMSFGFNPSRSPTFVQTLRSFYPVDRVTFC